MRQTPLFANLIKSHRGTRLPGCWDPFEFSVRAILGQQISVKAATTLAGRIARAYGKFVTLDAPQDISHYFPDAFPASDLGIIKMLLSDETPIKPGQIELMAEDWRPWRACAAIYLWQG